MTTDVFVAPTNRAVVAVTGEERAGYLDDVTSQELAELGPGDVRGTLWLDPNGKLLAAFDVVVREDRLLLVVPGRELAGELVETLGGRTFLRDADFEHTDLAVLALRGGDAAAIARQAGMEQAAGAADRPGTAAALDGDGIAVGRPDGLDLVVPGDDLEEHTARLAGAGAGEADADRLEAWRIRAGEPAWGSEITPPHLPEEIGLLPTHVHLAKGCYPGQETVARMWMLGQPRRRLARVTVPTGVEAGSTLGDSGGRVMVTSVTPDAEAAGDRRAALAFVPPDTEPGTTLEPDGARVEVEAIVNAELDIPGREAAGRTRRDREAAETS